MQLTVGDTINVGVRLYRLNWKKYLKLSLISHLWLLVPIYGWGKHLAIASQISDLGYQQLTDCKALVPSKPANVRLSLQFLLTSIVISIISYVGVFIVLFIIFFILAIIFGLISALITPIFNLGVYTSLLTIPMVILFYILLFLAPTWIYARLFLTDPILAVESTPSFFSPIARSYNLTKTNQLQIIKTIWLSFAVTIPIIVAMYLLFGFITGIILALISRYLNDRNTAGFIFIYLLFFFTSTNLLITPFWQSIKAIIYYQTRCDREGLDLSLNI